MQAYHQPRVRKTPFGDLPAPDESRYVRADFVRPERGEDAASAAYEIFSLKPAIDGLGSAAATERPARN
jgi:hypothetical protein